MAAAFGVLLPALVHGTSLGPFDLLAQVGLTQQSGVAVHNGITSDQIRQFIPWTSVAWSQVHHGALPLWNPYSALGMPLAFNWQSATFSVPALVGYLFPLHLAYTVQVIVTLIIAGTGAYVLARVLHLGALGCVTAATVYELSGAFQSWLGWPQASAFVWTGWIFAAALLVIRGGRRVRHVAFFAVVLACMIYSGFPDSDVLVGLALAVFLVVLLGQRAFRHADSGAVVRPLVDLAIAVVAGAALGAPLALPGLQLSAGSWRSATASLPLDHVGLPVHDLVNFVFQGFYGLPVAGSHWFGSPSYFYYPGTAAYVGVIAVVLAATALALRRQDPEIIAFGAVAIAMAAAIFVAPLYSLLNRLPSVGGVLWVRALMPMSLAIAVLAGVGIDVLVRSHHERTVRSWLGAGFAVAAVVLALLWVFGRGHLPPAEAAIRAKSFIWPAIETTLGLVVVGTLTLMQRTGRHIRADTHRWAAFAFVACETAFLVASGAPIMSSSPSYPAPTPAVTTLERAVGSSVVGGGTGFCVIGLGIMANANDLYGVRELAVYDPMTPVAYFRSWHAATGESVDSNATSLFCPPIPTAAVARRYGVGFVLEATGAPGPRGAVFDMMVGDEELYRIPGAGVATLTPLQAKGRFPNTDALGYACRGNEPGSGVVESGDRHIQTASAAPAAHRCSRMARQH